MQIVIKNQTKFGKFININDAINKRRELEESLHGSYARKMYEL